jgi:hypothetical protein
MQFPKSIMALSILDVFAQVSKPMGGASGKKSEEEQGNLRQSAVFYQG